MTKRKNIVSKMDMFKPGFTIIYTDGIKEHFNAIRITDKGVFIGKIIEGKFADYGFIFKNSIKEIYNEKEKIDTKK